MIFVYKTCIFIVALLEKDFEWKRCSWCATSNNTKIQSAKVGQVT
jgi:hypothetical protein